MSADIETLQKIIVILAVLVTLTFIVVLIDVIFAPNMIMDKIQCSKDGLSLEQKSLLYEIENLSREQNRFLQQSNFSKSRNLETGNTKSEILWESVASEQKKILYDTKAILSFLASVEYRMQELEEENQILKALINKWSDDKVRIKELENELDVLKREERFETKQRIID